MPPKPTVVVMCSITLDGKLAPEDESSSRPFLEQIPAYYRTKLDDLRESSDAIVVGNRTIKKDDSRLLPPSGSGLVRTVIDPEALLGEADTVVSDDESLLVVVDEATEEDYVEWLSEQPTIDVLRCEGDAVDLHQLMDYYTERGVEQVLLEGGGGLINHFVNAELVDRVKILVMPYISGDADAVSLVEGSTSLFPEITIDIEERDVKDDFTLIDGRVQYADD